MKTVTLGYELGTGNEVVIPVRHMAVTGQTQEAGKTTTLEALITRSALRAVTFVTKRGESSFAGARRIQPYFREQTDWRFVASVLEASQGEKLKFERPWIMRAVKGAKTLRDVHANVKAALEKAKGLSADIYLALDHYLDIVVPSISAIAWASRLDLAAGVNVIDLSRVPVEMQHLVIKSALDWVLACERDVITVIPEAWNFVPQSRNTPVKLAAVALLRQGAALGNYVWLDSQDLGGIDKEVLRQVPVWLLGVQRETNEIKRTLDNIPASTAKPKPADIALLEIGQFIACHGKHTIKTYVQPAWMETRIAIGVARGDWPVQATTDYRFHHAPQPIQEDTVNAAEAQELRETNARLQQAFDDATYHRKQAEERARQLESRLAALEAVRGEVQGGPKRSVAAAAVRAATQSPDGPNAQRQSVPSTTAVASFPPGFIATDTDAEGLYQAFKNRLIAELPSDIQVMRVICARPELVVEVARKVITIEGASNRGRVARLMASGWYAQGRSVSAVRAELKRTGTDPGGGGALYDIHKAFLRDGFFVAEGDRFVLAPGVKVTERELQTV